MKRAIIALCLIFICSQARAAVTPQKRIKVITGVDKPVIMAGTGENIVVKVGLQAPDDGQARSGRPPVNVAIVLDKSGSMASSGKIENAKQGAIEVIEHLNYGDVAALVVYDNHARVLVEAQPLENKEMFIDAIRSIRADGSTALYDGVNLAAGQVTKYSGRGYINKIILLSDGLANVGPQSTGDLAALGQDLYDNEEIIITTIGVGLDYNEDLMTALAETGGGSSYFARNSDELPKIFAEEISETMTLAAKDINIILECAGAARPLNLIGRKGEVKKQTMTTSIKNLYGKNEKYVLFEIAAPAQEDGTRTKVATIRVEYSRPGDDHKYKEETHLTLAYNKNRDFVENSCDKKIIKDAALTRLSESKKEAIQLADKGNYDQAAQVIGQQAVMLEKIARQCDNDKEMAKEARRCETESQNIYANKGMSRHQRKLFTNDAYTQTTQQSYVTQSVTVEQ